MHVSHCSPWVLTSTAFPPVQLRMGNKSIYFEWEGTETGAFFQRALGREVWPEKNGV